ncbi:MAG: acetylxylan esterase [Gemmatimonadota bacterium]|nr:acetylxylan esterase [Gemmatimonadota bacterium]
MVRNISRSALILMVFFMAVTALAAETAKDKISLDIVPDHSDYLYSLGERCVFQISVDVEKFSSLRGEPEVTYRLSEDRERTLDQGSLELNGGSAKLTGALDRPGFLRLDVKLIAGADTLYAECGCGFEVEAIRPTGALPDDFDRFWREARAELLRIPINPKLEPYKPEEPVPGAKYFRVSLATVNGTRVYGKLIVPRGKGPFPTVLNVPYAGVYQVSEPDAYARAGMLVLSIDAHGLPQDRPEQWYRRLGWRFNGPLADYPHFGKEDPYTFYFRRVIQGAFRAMDYLYSRQDVDTTRVGAGGSSQGGALSLLLGGLDKRIKALISNVPAMCDHTGSLYGRPSGWPRLLKDGNTRRIVRTAAYYDAALNAGLIEVPARIGVGFVDRTCAPTTVYAAYNNLKGIKIIDNYPMMGHSVGEGWYEEAVGWLLDRLNERAAGSSPAED